MWKIIFTILIFAFAERGFSAFLTKDCGPEKCKHLLPNSFRRNDFLLLSAEELSRACPNLLEFIDCLSEELQTCANTNFEELAAAEDKEDSVIGTILLGVTNLVRDVCNEDTKIHKDYIENIDCIKRVLMRKENEDCVKEGNSLYSAYSSEPNSESNAECLVSGYIFACLSGQLNKDCGEGARHTFIDIVKRTKFIQSQICSPEDIQELKTEFKEYLQLEGERQSIFEQAFDLKKRK